MNNQQFSELLRNPGSADTRSLALLEDLVSRYPWCQSAHLLYTFNLFREDDPGYPAQLKKAAAYAGDRRILKELIGLGKTPNQPQVPIQPAEDNLSVPLQAERRGEQPGITTPEEPEAFTAVAGKSTDGFVVTWELSAEPAVEEIPAQAEPPEIHDRMTQEELLAIVKKRLAEINGEKNAAFSGLYEKTDAAHPVSKKALIDKFILDEPRISKPKAAFFNPTDSAIRSNLDEEEIVSETLAQLYAKQGNIQKAIHIYEKLSLVNQEKSRYFAGQIKNLSS